MQTKSKTCKLIRESDAKSYDADNEIDLCNFTYESSFITHLSVKGMKKEREGGKKLVGLTFTF